MDVTCREGKKEDSYRIAELIDIASMGAVEFLFHDLVPRMSPVQLVAYNLLNDRFPHSYRSAIVAEHEGLIVGMALAYPSKYNEITEGMKEFFPPDRLEHFGAHFTTRVENSYFIDALAVDESYREKGIGSRLMDLVKEKAKEEGFYMLSLFVFADNANARRFYERHGFEIHSHVDIEYHELMPHDGGSLLLKCEV
jgi:ribosomal protein S18 acetylase RimI-like enzyme